MPSLRSNKKIFSIHKNHKKEDRGVFKNDENRYNLQINATQKNKQTKNNARIITFLFPNWVTLMNIFLTFMVKRNIVKVTLSGTIGNHQQNPK